MKLVKALVRRTTYTIGKMLRETGLAMDVRGSVLTGDIAYQEPLSRHRQTMGIYDLYPHVPKSAVVAPNATLIGDVVLGPNSSVYYGAVIRGDINAVRIGNNSIVGDNTTINTTAQLPIGVPTSVNIGNNVKIEHNCSLYSCTIDDNVTVGFKSVVLEGALIERGSVIGPNSVVPAGRLIPANQYWEGSPVQYVRDLTDKDHKKAQQLLDQEKVGAIEHSL